jgi:hypothetical protein
MKRIINLIIILLIASIAVTGCTYEKRDLSEEGLTQYFTDLGWTDIEISAHNFVVAYNVRQTRSELNEQSKKIQSNMRMKVIFGDVDDYSHIAFVPQSTYYDIEIYRLEINKNQFQAYVETHIENADNYILESRVMTGMYYESKILDRLYEEKIKVYYALMEKKEVEGEYIAYWYRYILYYENGEIKCEEYDGK